MVAHDALIGATAFSNDGMALLKNVVSQLKEVVEVKDISSIYRVNNSYRQPENIHDLKRLASFEGLSVAFRISTNLSPLELMKCLEALENRNRSEKLHRSISLNLFAFEDYTVMTPQLTLPHPEFHKRADQVFPAAEVWGNYTHPVSGEMLNAMTRRFANLRWGEFFAQGKSLLDF